MSKPLTNSWPFHFLDELVLRTPALPFVEVLNENSITTLLEDNNFMEAVFLASPVLYAECVRLKNGAITEAKEIRKIRISLTKYYQRMYSRCTPFGLFSGCSLVKWQTPASGIELHTTSFLRNTRLDMHYLCAAGQYLSAIPVIKERLLYFPNNSAYRMGGELRYIEYRYYKGKRIHQISSVQYSDYLEAVLEKTKAGAAIPAILQMVTGFAEVTEEEALEFIDEMIAGQVLISEMDPAITGDEFIHQVLAVLHKINVPEAPAISAIINELEIIVQTLKRIDTNFHNPPELYIALAQQIRELGIAFEENKLFQVDMYCRPDKNSIDEEVKTDLQKAITLLAGLFPPVVNDNLHSFAERFRKRYEDQALPLLQVLDAETGIGYLEQSATNLSPLLENLAMPGRKERDTYDIKWNKTEQWLFSLLQKNTTAREVVLEEKDLAGFTTDFTRFPPSLSVLFSKIEGGRIVLKGCSGSSAANLLGRFAHADESINELILKITKQEQQLNQEVILAEIVHLPEDRVGNILLHPAFREYEIPFLAQSSLPDEKQVSLQDILVSVGQDKRIRLFSKKLNREIIPRLSNAHNYSVGALPVYQLLAELQSQGLTGGLAFNWGSMSRHFHYLPRVRCGNVVLAEATWQLQKEHFEELISAGSFSKEVLDEFRKRWQLPRLFVLAEADNELLVDCESGESVDTFIKTIKGRQAILLKEYLRPCPHAVTNEEHRVYNNQFVAILMNEQKVYTGQSAVVNMDNEADSGERKFLPGSEWLYYKIYCGSKTADELLLTCIAPLTQQLLANGWIDKWFYIRYNDPDFHLRVRFHLSAMHNMGKVIEQFLHSIKAVEEEGMLWKLQIDTYQREAERYGTALIEPAEDLFFTDSKMKLEFLSLTGGDDREQYRWRWGMRGTDELLNGFGYTLEEKYVLMQLLKETFTREFNADKSLFRQLNQQYNDNRKFIQLAMEQPVAATNEMKPLLAIYDTYRNEIQLSSRRILEQLGEEGKQAALANLLSSYIHMSLNRLFLSDPRQHEMVIYDFLCTHYRSLIKKNG